MTGKPSPKPDSWPRITVIIAAYNAADTIGPAVRSALSQTIPAHVIVVDDASSDHTVDAAWATDDGAGRLAVLVQPENRGPAAARNRALDAVPEGWVTILDADDQMDPDRLRRLLSVAWVNNWDFAGDDLLRLTNWDRRDQAVRHWKDNDFGEIELSLERFVDENDPGQTGHGRELGFLKPVMQLRFLNEKGLRYDENLRLGEDFVLYAAALAEGARFGLVDPLGYYAFDTPGSLSKSHSATDLRNFHRAVRNLAIRPNLPAGGQMALRRQQFLSHKRWAWARQIEAVRRKDVLDFLGAFFAPPGVIFDLIGQLFGHFSRVYKKAR